MTPRVSVGMPVYNGERWLPQAVESILGQTYRDLELVILDNASTDNTEQICRAYAAGDKRVKYLRNERNIGINNNYNRAVRCATGVYFKWASSNDTCDSTLVAKCVEILDSRPDVVLCYAKTRLVREGNSEDYKDNLDLPEASPCVRLSNFLDRLRLNNAMNGVFRSEALRKTPLLKDYLSADVVLMAELALHGKFIEVPEFLFYRRMTPDTTTGMKSETELIDYYDPERQRRFVWQHWKLNLGFWSAVWRTPLPMREKLCLYLSLSKRLWWARNKLIDDIATAAKNQGSGLESAPVRLSTSKTE